jgi:hypothetical protein
VWASPARLGAFALGIGALFAYGWWATGLQPFSAAASLATVGPGIAAVVIGTAVRRPTVPAAALSGAVVWAVLVGALVAWQMFAYLQHPRSEHPTLSSLANSVLDTQPARAVAFTLWLIAAALLARR